MRMSAEMMRLTLSVEGDWTADDFIALFGALAQWNALAYAAASEPDAIGVSAESGNAWLRRRQLEEVSPLYVGKIKYASPGYVEIAAAAGAALVAVELLLKVVERALLTARANHSRRAAKEQAKHARLEAERRGIELEAARQKETLGVRVLEQELRRATAQAERAEARARKAQADAQAAEARAAELEGAATAEIMLALREAGFGDGEADAIVRRLVLPYVRGIVTLAEEGKITRVRTADDSAG